MQCRSGGKREKWKAVRTSIFGVIPKGKTGKWQLIVDVSSPESFSVNDAIDPSLCTLTYCGVEDVVREVRGLGQITMLAKVDVKSAYRAVPVTDGCVWEVFSHDPTCQIAVIKFAHLVPLSLYLVPPPPKSRLSNASASQPLLALRSTLLHQLVL